VKLFMGGAADCIEYAMQARELWIQYHPAASFATAIAEKRAVEVRSTEGISDVKQMRMLACELLERFDFSSMPNPNNYDATSVARRGREPVGGLFCADAPRSHM